MEEVPDAEMVAEGPPLPEPPVPEPASAWDWSEARPDQPALAGEDLHPLGGGWRKVAAGAE